MEEKIKEKLKICKRNKRLGLFGVTIVLTLSFVLVNKGINKINSEKGILEKTVVTQGLDNVRLNILKVPLDSSNCILPIEVETVPIIATEENYNNTANVLLCVSALMFIILALWGAFTFLLKVLKSEHEINSKVLDVELGIYKEEQMRQIADRKNDKEYNDKIRELNSAENQRGLKYLELNYKKEEFNGLEKVKQEFEHNLKVNKQDGNTETKPSSSTSGTDK